MTEATCQCCDCIQRCPSISLQQWFDIMCVNPYYGFQLAQNKNVSPGTPIPLTVGMPCSELIYENPTQGGQVSGRAWIWDAILDADEKFHNFTRYWPVPTQVCDEYHFQKPYTDGIIRLKDTMIKALGQLTYTLVDNVTPQDNEYLDLNNDGVIDTVRTTFLLPTTVGLDEIALFMHADDREYVDSFCRAEIRHFKAKFTTGRYVQLEIPTWNLVRPILYRGYKTEPIDPNVIANYVPKFDVYRKWIDPKKAITIMRRTDVGCACEPSTKECYDCENVDACIVNADLGIIRVDMREDKEKSCYCRKCASRMCIHYVAGDCGYPKLIARLAAAELRGDICCGTSAEVRYWQADYVGTDSRGRVTTSLLVSEQGNQFGTKRGQVEAYRYLRERRKFKAARI